MTTPTTPVQADARSAATPGPWRAAEVRHDYDQVIRDADNGPVALVQLAGYTKPTGRANATLIAQAWTIPALRAALRECEEYFDQRADADQPSGLSPMPNEEMTLLMEVRAALADGET